MYRRKKKEQEPVQDVVLVPVSQVSDDPKPKRKFSAHTIHGVATVGTLGTWLPAWILHYAVWKSMNPKRKKGKK